MEYLIPNYFDKFKCKCGECRNTCCVGWTVSMSLEEWFKLKNIDCDDEFREKIDRGIYTFINPSADRYAYIKKDYYGDCVFHGQDGLCEMHKKFGEDKIANVCRMYPKSIKNSPDYEKSCSNSCEAVIELLINEIDKITFNNYLENNKIEIDCINIIQEDESLINKFKKIGKYLNVLDDTYEDTNLSTNSILKVIYDYILLYKDKHNSIDEYIEIMENLNLKYLIESNKFDYLSYKQNLYAIVPNYDSYISKLLANHILFSNFPYKDNNDKKLPLYSLCGVYSFVTFIVAVILNYKYDVENDLNKQNIDKNLFVDILTKVFRLCEHSQFPVKFGLYLESIYSNNNILNLIKL